MFKIYIKSQRNKNKSDSYCERLQKKSSQVRPYINIPQYLKFSGQEEICKNQTSSNLGFLQVVELKKKDKKKES